MMEAVRTSGTSVCFYETTLRYIPEGCDFQIRRREKLKSHKDFIFIAVSKLAPIQWVLGDFPSRIKQLGEPG
jgi:hypothetical protein